jgi:hypothetical protein
MKRERLSELIVRGRVPYFYIVFIHHINGSQCFGPDSQAATTLRAAQHTTRQSNKQFPFSHNSILTFNTLYKQQKNQKQIITHK